MTQINSFGRISIRKVFYDHGAVIAQVVERRLGKAEVTGSSPVNSFEKDLTFVKHINRKGLGERCVIAFFFCVKIHTVSAGKCKF